MWNKKRENDNANYHKCVPIHLVYGCKDTKKKCITFSNLSQLLPFFNYLSIFTLTILNQNQTNV